MINFAARIVRKEPIAREHLLSYRGIVSGAAIVLVALAFHGAGFALLLGSFVTLDLREFVAAAAIFNLAGVVGIAVLPVPSGIGVREAVLITLLQLFVPLEIAAAAAVLARVAGFLIDIVFGLGGAALWTLRRRREDAVQDQPAPAQELKAA